MRLFCSGEIWSSHFARKTSRNAITLCRYTSPKRNLGKRLIKTPKVYWGDSGLACHLLGITSEAELQRSPFLGQLFEGFVAAEILKNPDADVAAGSVARVHPASTLVALFDELLESGLNVGRKNAELCAKLLECLAFKITGANAPLKDAETLAFVTYQHCLQHIERYFLRLRTLEEIAEECHTNNSYLCRLFRRYDNQTPYQCLLRLKMNYAAARLQSPGTLVKQVAEEVAFPDPFHFSRVFKNVLGVSPDSFRKLR